MFGILYSIKILSKQKKKWKNSPFTEEQESWTILEYGALRNYLQVGRKFRTHFKLSPRKAPCMNSFKSLVDRFIIEKPTTIPAAVKGSVSGAEQRVVTPVLAQWVKMVVHEAVSCGRAISVTELAGKFDISRSSAWTLLKNQLSDHIRHTDRKQLYH